jgi:hypothetical protein
MHPHLWPRLMKLNLRTIVEKMIGCQSFIWRPGYPKATAIRGSSGYHHFLERVIGKAEAEHMGAGAAPIRFQFSEPAATRSPSVR